MQSSNRPTCAQATPWPRGDPSNLWQIEIAKRRVPPGVSDFGSSKRPHPPTRGCCITALAVRLAGQLLDPADRTGACRRRGPVRTATCFRRLVARVSGAFMGVGQLGSAVDLGRGAFLVG